MCWPSQDMIVIRCLSNVHCHSSFVANIFGRSNIAVTCKKQFELLIKPYWVSFCKTIACKFCCQILSTENSHRSQTWLPLTNRLMMLKFPREVPCASPCPIKDEWDEKVYKRYNNILATRLLSNKCIWWFHLILLPYWNTHVYHPL